MRIDWDKMQPPNDRYNYLASSLNRLRTCVGNTTANLASAYVRVVILNGFTGDTVSGAHMVRQIAYINALRKEPADRTPDDHIAAMEWLAEKFVDITLRGAADGYLAWYRKSFDIIPNDFTEVPTTGWEHV